MMKRSLKAAVWTVLLAGLLSGCDTDYYDGGGGGDGGGVGVIMIVNDTYASPARIAFCDLGESIDCLHYDYSARSMETGAREEAPIEVGDRWGTGDSVQLWVDWVNVDGPHCGPTFVDPLLARENDVYLGATEQDGSNYSSCAEINNW